MPELSNRQVLLISAVVDTVLTILKILGGWLLNSHALVVDGIHSFSDLITDLLAWFFMHLGSHDPDPGHPYGHARFETFGTLILGSSLLLVAGVLIYDSALRLLLQDDVIAPNASVLIIAALSILCKEWLYRVSISTAQRVRSRLLLGNAWHHRSDALSSVMVFVGVGGSLLGAVWCEFVASIAVSVMIARVGWTLARGSVEELVDTALSQEQSEKINACALSTDGVRGVHSLRTRQMGHDILLDIHLQVDPGVSVSEGHHIGEWMTRELLRTISDITDVVFHIDAENDLAKEHLALNRTMAPLRTEVRTMLEDSWRPISFSNAIEHFQLHYLNDSIEVEVFLPKKLLQEDGYSHNDFYRQISHAATKLPWINKISVWYG